MLPLSAGTPDISNEGGHVFFVKGMSPQFDRYIDRASRSDQSWMRQHFFRMVSYSPSFDKNSAWYPDAWFYFDAYAMYRHREPGGTNLAVEHPEWILGDTKNYPSYIPWGCSGSPEGCPQYAADVSNPEYQRWWIDSAKRTLNQARYKGVWIDDVNMDFRVSDVHGNFVTPIDRNTHHEMREQAWRKYFAEFLENIRKALPGVEIVHNAIWYAGGELRDRNPEVRREIAAADWIYIEKGVNDNGLTANGKWSLTELLAYVDRVHALGKSVVIGNLDGEDQSTAARLYTLANYFLISSGRDAVCDWRMGVVPQEWRPELSVELGAPLDKRKEWNHLVRRDFVNGIVLVSGPENPTVSVRLEKSYKTLYGSDTSSVTLAAKQATILLAK